MTFTACFSHANCIYSTGAPCISQQSQLLQRKCALVRRMSTLTSTCIWPSDFAQTRIMATNRASQYTCIRMRTAPTRRKSHLSGTNTPSSHRTRSPSWSAPSHRSSIKMAFCSLCGPEIQRKSDPAPLACIKYETWTTLPSPDLHLWLWEHRRLDGSLSWWWVQKLTFPRS